MDDKGAEAVKGTTANNHDKGRNGFMCGNDAAAGDTTESGDYKVTNSGTVSSNSAVTALAPL